MFCPLLITITYLISSNFWIGRDDKINFDTIEVVLRNLIITELLYLAVWLSGIATKPIVAEHAIYHECVTFAWFVVINDIWVYLTHRMAHMTRFYKYHKLHHQQFNSFAAWYCSIVEHILINIGSIVVPTVLLGIDTYLFHFIISLATIRSVYVHSQSSNTKAHHYNTTKRFGVVYIMDRILHTY